MKQTPYRSVEELLVIRGGKNISVADDSPHKHDSTIVIWFSFDFKPTLTIFPRVVMSYYLKFAVANVNYRGLLDYEHENAL